MMMSIVYIDIVCCRHGILYYVWCTWKSCGVERKTSATSVSLPDTLTCQYHTHTRTDTDTYTRMGERALVSVAQFRSQLSI
jgi:hypothetical protein